MVGVRVCEGVAGQGGVGRPGAYTALKQDGQLPRVSGQLGLEFNTHDMNNQ